MTKTVAQVLAESLLKLGVEKVFGLPGGEVVELLDELRKSDIDFILARNESSAVFMADSYAQVKRSIGVCLTTLGPGATNAVMGVAHSYLDRTPVIVITAQKPDSELVGYTHQVVDLYALYAPITKASLKVTAANAHEVIQKAVDIATAGRPGPVHLQLASDEAAKPAKEDTVNTASTSRAGDKPVPDVETVQLAAKRIREAERPAIVVGLGMEPQAAYVELVKLAEQLNAPVFVMPKAKGAISTDHPLYAGTIGLSRNEPLAQIINEADCVLAIGFDVVELVEKWSYSGPVIWIAGWANQDPVLPTVHELVGDMGKILLQLADANTHNSELEQQKSWASEHITEIRKQGSSQKAPIPSAGRVTPQSVLSIMRDLSEADAYLTVDVGAHKIYSSANWDTSYPNRFLLSNGLSSMSYALPAAIGIIEANPESQVLCLTGDAGLAMCVGELGVMAERNLHVTVIVLNDGAIDLIRSHQRRAGKPVFGTEFTPPNYSAIGSAFGIRCERVDSERSFKKVLHNNLMVPAPSLIEVMLDPAGYPTTPK